MNPLLLFLFLLFSMHAVFASTPTNHDDDAYLAIQKIIDGNFSQVAALAQGLFTSGQCDSVFRHLRQGHSPTDITNEIISDVNPLSGSAVKVTPSLGPAKSTAFTESFCQQNPHVFHPRVLQRAPVPRHHFQPIAHHHHPIPMTPIVPAGMYPAYHRPAPTISIKQHLAALTARTMPRVFLIYSGTANDFLQPKLSLVAQICNFFNLQADLNVPFYNASYLAIPSPYSNPRAVSHMASIAPSISTSFPLTALLQKLLLLNEALLDDRVFKEVLAVQINFDTRIEVTVSILFRDVRKSFEINHDFFQIALEEFTA